MNPESNLHVVSPPVPTAQVISLAEIQAESTHAGAPVMSHANPLLSVRTRIQAVVGQIDLTVGELLAAKEHQVLVLQRAVDEPIELLLEGKVVARGQLVAVDGKFGIRITELPIPLKV